jgi:hypothetical protein
MNKKFIHLGCEISVDGNIATVRKPDGSRERITLYLTKSSVDFDGIEKTLKDYIDLKFGETLITV